MSDEIYIVINKNTGQPTPYTNFDSAYGAICWLTGTKGTPRFKQNVRDYLKYFEVAHIFARNDSYSNTALYKSKVHKEFK